MLTSLQTFEKFGKTKLEVRFYSFPTPIETLWFYKDKTIFKRQLTVGTNMHEIPVKLRINTKSVIVNGYNTSHVIDGVMSTDIKLYSCQIRNSIGNLDVSFSDIKNNRNQTSYNGNYFYCHFNIVMFEQKY